MGRLRSMPRPEEDRVEKEPLGSRRHRAIVGVVGECDDVPFAQSSGTTTSGLPAISSSVCGQQKPLTSRSREAKFTRFRPSVGLSGVENQVGVDQRKDLGRRAESDEVVVIDRGAQERARHGVGRFFGLLAVGLRLGRAGRLVSLLGGFLSGSGLARARS